MLDRISVYINFGGLELKIVYVVPVLAPYAIPRFQELAKIDGVEVHVIVEKATSSDRIGWKFEDIDGVTTHLIKNHLSHRFLKTNKSGNYTQNEEHVFSLGLKKIIKSIAPDIVLVCNSSQLLMLIGHRKYKLGVIVEDTLRADEGRKKINRIVKKKLLKIADFYCTFSDDSVDFLSKYGIKGPIIKTSWSMDNKDFTDMTNDEVVKFRIDNEIDSNKKNFFIVANLIKRKGIIEFLHSWKSLPKNVMNNVGLFIAGEGQERENINNFINSNNLTNVKLLGHVDYENVKKYLQSIDVFVLPTLEDVNSLAVFEALAASRPLLISQYAGAQFVVENGINGYVFDPYNVDDTMKKIIYLFDCDLSSMVSASKRISDQYTNEIIMKKFYYDLSML